MNVEFIPMILIFAIPIIAIVGGIISGIVKTLREQRLVELAQRERMLAIERGIPLEKLPPLHVSAGISYAGMSFAQSQLRRSQGLMIGGLITFAIGFAMMVLLTAIPEAAKEGIWPVGLVPLFVGIALLISAWIVRPKSEDWQRDQAGLGPRT